MKTINEPGLTFEGETWEGGTLLDFNGNANATTTFRDMTFIGPGTENGTRALLVPRDKRPWAQFYGCTFKHADKAVLGHWLLFKDCDFMECEDGIFDQGEGRLHIEGNRFHNTLGGASPSHHPDAVQTSGGPDCRHFTIRGNEFDMPGANSWCFIESKLGPIYDVRIVDNKGTGGMYHVYLWNDGYGAPLSWVDYNVWDNHIARLPVAYNFAGGEDMIGPNNRYKR